MKKIYLARHGETNYNRDGLVQGQIDEKSWLTSRGRKQISVLGRDFREHVGLVDLLVSSDLRRARESAKIISEYILPQDNGIRFTQDLRERGLGPFEGDLLSEAIQGNDLMQMYGADTDTEVQRNGRVIKCGFEPLAEVYGRFQRVIDEVLGESEVSKVFLMSHGEFASYALNHLFGDSRRYDVENGRLHYLEMDDDGTLKNVKLNVSPLEVAE